jgi:hypothetical protein
MTPCESYLAVIARNLCGYESRREREMNTMPAICVVCGKEEGPVIEVGKDCLGWMCQQCYQGSQDRLDVLED